MILDFIHTHAEAEYAAFSARLIPNIPAESVAGVRTPLLRQLASRLNGAEAGEFMSCLPHGYHEENILHAILISRTKNVRLCLALIDDFLPFVDNWAVCDSIRPAVLCNDRVLFLAAIRRWLSGGHPYSRRFAMEMLMCYFLDEHFDAEFPALVAGLKSDDYYVRMMQAWYFATALAKQWEQCFGYIRRQELPLWVHNKAIQKAVESRSIPEDKKILLKSFKL